MQLVRPSQLGRIGGRATGGAAADVTAPTLSLATAGTPTSDGATNFGVTTDEGNGTLYWAVVTNGGSCTDAQLKAGAGGNIVAGKAGSQAVTTTGAQSISTITGLTSSTTYQIKYLQRDAAGNDSSQASVDLTTSAAIAVDATSESALGSNPTTWSHTCTGANRLLLVGCFGSVNIDDVSGVTYNGVAMTLAAKVQAPSGGRFFYLWYLLAPATGANTVSINGSAQTAGVAASYTGVAQSGQPNVSNTLAQSSATSISASVTTTVNNCWTMMVSGCTSVAPITAGSGTTLRKDWSFNSNLRLFDSNGPLATGATTLNGTHSSSNDASVIAAFAPA